MMLIGNWKENESHGKVVKYDSNGSRTEYEAKNGKEHGSWAITALENDAFAAAQNFKYHEGALVTPSNRVIGLRNKKQMGGVMSGKLGLALKRKAALA